MESQFTADANDRRNNQLRNSDLIPKDSIDAKSIGQKSIDQKANWHCLTSMSSQALHMYIS